MEGKDMQSIPSKEFPREVSFDSKFPKHEFAGRGVCQLFIASFKELYELNQKFLKLDKLKELSVIKYADNSFALSWWPHQLYRLETDEIFVHKEFALTTKGKEAHASYVEKELEQKNDLEQKFQELFEKSGGSIESVGSNSQAL